MLRSIAVAAVALSAAAASQVTSYSTNNPAALKGDADKIVCVKEEKIGTRLGGKKVGLTVLEWTERARLHQERTQQIQSGTCQVGEGQGCLDPIG